VFVYSRSFVFGTTSLLALSVESKLFLFTCHSN
jgi:hypothetical protein